MKTIDSIFVETLGITLLFVFVINISSAQRIWYVNAEQAGNGTSWANATWDLQQAIDSAQAGDSIWVTKGIYKPTSKTFKGTTFRFRTFLIDKNVHIYGGFSGGETKLEQRNWEQNESFISGQLSPTDKAYHIITILGQSSHAITDLQLDGFIIEHGNADGPSTNPVQQRGGAVYIDNNNYITNPTFYNCIFRNNFAFQGGAINITGTDGQALPTFVNCTFHNNTAQWFGGAFNLDSDEGSNQMTLFNCSLTHNTCGLTGNGGAIYLSGGNSIFIGAKLYNTILWDNESEEIGSNAPLALVQAFNCIVDDGNPDGMVNGVYGWSSATSIDYDPLFVDPANGNLRVYKQSPAIDAGSDSNLPAGADWDLLHKPRIHADSVDIGAYENYCPQASPQIYVHQSASGDNTGASWTNAYYDLQEGMDQACLCDSTSIVPVWVAEGTYYPTRRFDESNPQTARFLVDKNVKLYGGFRGNESALEERYLAAHQTILEGDIGVPGDTSDNVESIMEISTFSGVPITTDCVIDGFIFQNGGYELDNNRGGGISLIRSTALNTPIIANCLFRNNRGLRGGFYSIGAPLIYNSVFYNNVGSQGGALSTFSFDTATYIVNCTFYNNRAMVGGAILHRNDNLYIHNSIFWENGDEIKNDGNTIDLSYSTFDDGNPDGSMVLPANISNAGGNIDSDPVLVDAADGNLRLTKTSPAIDQGNNTFILSLSTDLDGQPRINQTVDMGAYENPYSYPCLSKVVIDNSYGPIDGLYQSDQHLILGLGAIIGSDADVRIIAPQVEIRNDVIIESGAEFQIISGFCGG